MSFERALDDGGEVAISIIVDDSGRPSIEAFQPLRRSHGDEEAHKFIYSHSYLTACDPNAINLPDRLQGTPTFISSFFSTRGDSRGAMEAKEKREEGSVFMFLPEIGEGRKGERGRNIQGVKRLEGPRRRLAI